MAQEQESTGFNNTKSLIVNASDASRQPVTLWADKTTHRLLVDAGTITVSGAKTSVGSGQQNVTTAGTAVQLPSNACGSVVIKAKTTNTGNIFVGPSAVTSANGLILSPGESISMDITNTNLIYLNSAVNGEGVSYLYLN